MKIKDLINKLKQYDQDSEVVFVEDNDWCCISEVCKLKDYFKYYDIKDDDNTVIIA